MYARERCALEHPGWIIETDGNDNFVVAAGDPTAEELEMATKHNGRVVLVKSRTWDISPKRSIGIFYDGYWAYMPTDSGENKLSSTFAKGVGRIVALCKICQNVS